MPWVTLPTVSADQAVRASWGNGVKNNDDDHETRIVALESGGGTGDVIGPASATDNAIARFDSTSGTLIQNSGITIADGSSGTLSGSNSGDVTLGGSPNYLTLAGQVLTRALIDLTAHITGRLPYANLTASTSATRLLGRGAAGGAGDWQEIALGTNLSMSGTTLNASGGGGGGALDDLSDVTITTPATGQILRYDGSAWVNAARRARNVGITIDGGGSTITTGAKGCVEVPMTGTITRATLLSTDASVTSGSIVIDVWKDTYANYPPTVADTITASAKPTLSSATKSQDTTLTGWTTAVTAGDILRFNVDSVTTLTRVTLLLRIEE